MESQPQNPEFRNNPKNFHPECFTYSLWGLMNSCLIFLRFRCKYLALSGIKWCWDKSKIPRNLLKDM